MTRGKIQPATWQLRLRYSKPLDHLYSTYRVAQIKYPSRHYSISPQPVARF